MHKLLALFVLFLISGIASAEENFVNQSLAELKKGIEAKHPVAYNFLAKKLFADPATKDEAVFWLYTGQVRYRY